jgi:hypothetical protein
MAIARASLWSVSLDVCDYPELVIGKKDALKIMQRMSQLRSITVNNVTWKVGCCHKLTSLCFTIFHRGCGLRSKLKGATRPLSLLSAWWPMSHETNLLRKYNLCIDVYCPGDCSTVEVV